MGLNLQICDNFLPQDTFDQIYQNIETFSFSAFDIVQKKDYGATDHVFYSSKIDPKDPLVSIIDSCLRKNFKCGIKRIANTCAWTMVSTREPTPHSDVELFKGEKHLLIYIKAKRDINCGTGFYITEKDNLILNTHIGFLENRAVLFDAKDCWHSPLLWNSDSLRRYSAIVWFEPEDL